MVVGEKIHLLKKGLYRIIFGKSLYTEYNDENLEWINYAHSSPEGGMPYKNQYLYREALAEIKSYKPIIEIGTFSGRSTSAILYLMDKLGRKNRLITTDPFKFLSNSETSRIIKMEDYEAHIKEQFMMNMKFWNSHHILNSFCFNSDEFFKKWEKNLVETDIFGNRVRLGGGISFCFLDGDHTFEQAYKDFSNIDNHLETGGMILFDDSGRYHKNAMGENGVYKVIRRVLQTRRYEVMHENPNFLVRKMRNA